MAWYLDKNLSLHKIPWNSESLQLDDDHDANVRKFLGLVKLLAIFDPVMKENWPM